MATRAVIEFYHNKQQQQPDIRVWQHFDARPDNVILTLESVYAFLEGSHYASNGDRDYSEKVACHYVCEQRTDDGHLNAKVLSASSGDIPYLSYRYVVRLSLGVWLIDIHDVEDDGRLVDTVTIGRKDSR